MIQLVSCPNNVVEAADLFRSKSPLQIFKYSVWRQKLNYTKNKKQLGPADKYDKTMKIEEELAEYLNLLLERNEMSQTDHDSSVPKGSSRPRMYGLPKIHKSTIPLRPILSMSGSPQYRVSVWLCKLLQSVLSLYSVHCVRDTFDFVELLSELSVPSEGCLCSFDVVSLFTNVPLSDTVDICADALFRNSLPTPTLSEASFRRLMLMVTSGVEFSFDNVMYRQCDGVAMGSPLGPVLANIFVGYCESRVSPEAFPPLYCRFVDDSFAFFDDEEKASEFKNKLDHLHPSLKFTCEFESSRSLSFLDVRVERDLNAGFVTSVYRKPTFTGMCLQWDAFCPVKYKVGLVRCLVNRAKRICSKSMLEGELDFLNEMFRKNGYPQAVINRHVTTPVPASVDQENDLSTSIDVSCTPDRGSVSSSDRRLVLRLPYTGPGCGDIERRVRCAVGRVFQDINIVTVYNSQRAFMVTKDVLPTLHISKVIYSFECRHCASRYVGRTLGHLNARIKQHVPLHLLNDDQKTNRPKRGRPPKLSQPPSTTTDKSKQPRRGKTASDVTKSDGVIGGVNIRRSERIRDQRPTDEDQPVTGYVTEVTTATTAPTRLATQRTYQSSIASHLALDLACRSSYSDSCFGVLSRGRSLRHLKVLESVYIHVQCPNLCVQKQNVAPLKLYKMSL